MAIPQAAAASVALETALAAEATATATAGTATGAGLAASVASNPIAWLTATLWFLSGYVLPHGHIASDDQEQESLKGESAARAIKQGIVQGFSANTGLSNFASNKIDASARPISKVSTKPAVQHQGANSSLNSTNFGVGTFPSINPTIKANQAKAPSLPPRRLSRGVRSSPASSINPPAPAATQALRVNAWVPTQTATQSSGKREYGQLLHNPVSKTKVNVPVYDTKDLQKKIQAQQKANITEFTNYISKADANMDLHDINILNIDLPNAKGEIKPTQIVGASTTRAIAQSYHERSKGATQFPTMSTAPLAIGATVIPVAVGVGLASNPTARGAASTAAKKAVLQAKNLGSKIPTEFNKLKAALDLSKLMQIVTLAGVVHNAAMLSNDLLGSCMQVVDNTMALCGIKNADGTAFDTKQIVGKKVEEFVTSIVGAKTVADTKRKFGAFNAIYCSMTNAYNRIQNLQQSMINIAEVGSSYTGRIGNALMRRNIIPVGSFKWMDENVEIENKRLNRLTTGLGNLTQIADDFATITGDLVSARDSIKELQDSKNEITKAVSDAEKVFATNDAAKDKASNPPVIKGEDE